MGQGWFGQRKRPTGEVDWARHVRSDTERADTVLWILAGINVAVFAGWSLARGPLYDTGFPLFMIENFRVSAGSVLSGRVWTLLTASFSHMEMWHLVFNLIGLALFGRQVARALGTGALLNLYLVGGSLAMLGHVLYNLFSGDPVPALGASGAVIALAVVYGAMFPDSTILVGFLLPLPARVAVGAFVVLDVLGLFYGGSNIAHAAHLAGAAYGLAYWYVKVRRPPPRRHAPGTFGTRL